MRYWEFKESAQYCYEAYHDALSQWNPMPYIEWDRLTQYEQDAWRAGVYAAMRQSWFEGAQRRPWWRMKRKSLRGSSRS